MSDLSGQRATRTLYKQNKFPVMQNKVYPLFEEARNCTLGDIEIVQDLITGLVFNSSFKPELMRYDSDYNNDQSNSGVFVEHLEWVARTIEAQFGKNDLIEVGCGKGFFLELLLERGFNIKGFDSTYDGNNPRILKKNFEPKVIKSIGCGLILRHVLEHIPNPIDFLFQLLESNGGQGLIYIEVPCFDWIMKLCKWFDILYEHVNYFRIGDFIRMFGHVIEIGHCFGGQYIYVIADLSSLSVPMDKGPYELNFPADFLASLGLAKQERCSEGQDVEVGVWGGASKGVIFSLLRERMGLPIDIVVDVSPAKQGKFLPATGLKVCSPEEALVSLKPGSPLYVMNSNYLEEIKRMSNYNFNYIVVDQ